jgi:competence protein ComEC
VTAEAAPASEPTDLRLAIPAVAAWVVAWQGRRLAPAVLLVVVALLVAAAAAVLLRRRTGSALVAAVLVCAAGAGLATAARTAGREVEPVRSAAAREAAAEVEAVVTDDPRRAVSPSARDLVVTRVRVEVLRVAGREHRLRVPVVVLSSAKEWLPLLPSQRVRVEGRLAPAEDGDDVAAVLRGRGPPVVLSEASAVQRVAGRLRQGLRDAVAPLPEAEQGLLPGLVVGDTSRLDPEVREDFRTVGLTHLTAVSGTNVAIVCGAVLLLSRRLGAGVRASPVLAAIALTGFVVLARPSPSVLRAAVMGVVGLVALGTGGRRAAVPALAAATLALVLLDPDLAATPGFALSVLATAGLLLLAPGWRDAWSRRMPAALAAALAVPAAAQVACGPVVVALAGELGLLSVPANLLAVVAVAPATVAGVLAAVLAPVWLPAAQLVAWLGWLPTAWLVRVARTGAAVPGAAVDWPDGARGAALLLVVTAVGWLVLLRRQPRLVVTAGLVGCLVASVGLRATGPSWPPPDWVLAMCDVGQGDMLVVRGGLVVDAGPEPEAADRCLDRLGVDRVPLLVLTHLHADHVDGLPGVLRRPVGLVEVGPLGEEEQDHDALRNARAAGVPVVQAALGEQRRLGDVSWVVQAPGRRYRGTRSDPNNSSLVLRLRAPGLTALLTGDVEPEAQRDLLANGVEPTDLLKVPHHGSAHQDPAFLSAARPRLALTSVGATNTYGHPADRTLEQLLDGGARSWRTDRDGDVAVAARDGAVVAAGRKGRGEVRGPVVQRPPASEQPTGWRPATPAPRRAPLHPRMRRPGPRGGGARGNIDRASDRGCQAPRAADPRGRRGGPAGGPRGQPRARGSPGGGPRRRRPRPRRHRARTG